MKVLLRLPSAALAFPLFAPCTLALALSALVPLAAGGSAQDPDDQTGEQDAYGDARLVVEPATLALAIGDKATLVAKVVDSDGAELDVRVMFFSRSRRSVTVDSEGNVEALAPGTHTIVCQTPTRTGRRLSVEVPVDVAYPPVAAVEFVGAPDRLYTGTQVQLMCRVTDASGDRRAGVTPVFSSSLKSVAVIDSFGNIDARRPGTFVAVAEVDGVRAAKTLSVYANPTVSIQLDLDAETVRTGDVLHCTAIALDAESTAHADVPIEFSFIAAPDDDLGAPAGGQIRQDGRFVAETPGRYTILATTGGTTARRTVRVTPRDVQRKLEFLGHGPVHDTHTSDLWVWEGADGRDYAVTGTWGANGEAHFWDVTDPRDLKRIATVRVDARTVNDVKVSPDGRICVISREGASNRRNGIVLYDVTNPAAPKELSTFDDELTGGVHNVFVDGDEVYALSAGRRYDIIGIADPRSPQRVGTFELDTPGHSIHDVWVVDGLAYSSNWRDGVQIVDVGNGMRGGSPANPVRVAGYAYPSGWNHAAFPYKCPDTGKFYVVAGDEAFPYGLHTEDTPTYPRGWLHFIDFTDLDNPDEVARYQVPEAGSHNFWIEDGLLYAAFYNGGVRVVDVSGELLGDLYRQGREIASFRPTHPDGYIANAPMVWGPQPHKGVIFLSDWNTGLWALELGEKDDRPR